MCINGPKLPDFLTIQSIIQVRFVIWPSFLKDKLYMNKKVCHSIFLMKLVSNVYRVVTETPLV